MLLYELLGTDPFNMQRLAAWNTLFLTKPEVFQFTYDTMQKGITEHPDRVYQWMSEVRQMNKDGRCFIDMIVDNRFQAICQLFLPVFELWCRGFPVWMVVPVGQLPQDPKMMQLTNYLNRLMQTMRESFPVIPGCPSNIKGQKLVLREVRKMTYALLSSKLDEWIEEHAKQAHTVFFFFHSMQNQTTVSMDTRLEERMNCLKIRLQTLMHMAHQNTSLAALHIFLQILQCVHVTDVKIWRISERNPTRDNRAHHYVLSIVMDGITTWFDPVLGLHCANTSDLYGRYILYQNNYYNNECNDYHNNECNDYHNDECNDYHNNDSEQNPNNDDSEQNPNNDESEQNQNNDESEQNQNNDDECEYNRTGDAYNLYLPYHPLRFKMKVYQSTTKPLQFFQQQGTLPLVDKCLALFQTQMQTKKNTQFLVKFLKRTTKDLKETNQTNTITKKITKATIKGEVYPYQLAKKCQFYLWDVLCLVTDSAVFDTSDANVLILRTKISRMYKPLTTQLDQQWRERWKNYEFTFQGETYCYFGMGLHICDQVYMSEARNQS